MRTFDSDALECLAAIVEEGGFERAALRLSVTQSAVSQRLRALEAQVGTVLLVRSRPIKPTSAGRLLIKHAMQMRLLRADLETDLQDLTPGTGALRVVARRHLGRHVAGVVGAAARQRRHDDAVGKRQIAQLHGRKRPRVTPHSVHLVRVSGNRTCPTHPERLFAAGSIDTFAGAYGAANRGR